ncbi:hypothetical protein L1887_29658 [Cichorium endivia]|nr:hypothetical protein L1887_29658 [Cichorium endivia]
MSNVSRKSVSENLVFSSRRGVVPELLNKKKSSAGYDLPTWQKVIGELFLNEKKYKKRCGWKKMHCKEGFGFLTLEAESDWTFNAKKMKKELEKVRLEDASSSDALSMDETEVLLRAHGEHRGSMRIVSHKLKGVSIDYQPSSLAPRKTYGEKKNVERHMVKMCDKIYEDFKVQCIS